MRLAIAAIAFSSANPLLAAVSNFDLDANGLNESSAASPFPGFICVPCTLTYEVSNGTPSVFDFDWQWGARGRFANRVLKAGPAGVKKVSFNTFLSVLLEPGNITWNKLPDASAIISPQAFPAQAYEPKLFALGGILGNLIGFVSDEANAQFKFESILQPYGSGFLITNSVTNNWLNTVEVDWAMAGVQGIVNPGESLGSQDFYADFVEEVFAEISLTSIDTLSGSTSFTSYAPSTYWKAVSVPAPAPFLGILAALKCRKRLKKLSLEIKKTELSNNF